MSFVQTYGWSTPKTLIYGNSDLISYVLGKKQFSASFGGFSILLPRLEDLTYCSKHSTSSSSKYTAAHLVHSYTIGLIYACPLICVSSKERPVVEVCSLVKALLTTIFSICVDRNRICALTTPESRHDLATGSVLTSLLEFPAKFAFLMKIS